MRKTLTPEQIEFHDAYTALMRLLRNDLRLYQQSHSIAEYAELTGSTLSTPPHWSDFIARDIKAKFMRRQGKLYEKSRWYRPVFDTKIRPLRSTQVRAVLERQMYEEKLIAEEQARSEHAAYRLEGNTRLQQLPVAAQYLKAWGSKKLPRNWLELLPPADRPIPHDDAPRQIVYVPPPPDYDMPPPIEKRGRGRPKGSKDSEPRTRSKLTPAQREHYTLTRRQNRSYQQIVLNHKLGVAS